MAKNQSKPATPKAPKAPSSKKAAAKKASNKVETPTATEVTEEKRPYKGW